MYTVLLVDDEKNIIESLTNGIPWENLGVESILSADSGPKALALMQNQPVDLLITDIRMPHMDGLELLQNVRRLYPDMHCILLTAFGEFEYARTALKLGVDNYLMKPLQIQELTESVENALDNIYINRKNKEALFRENIICRWITGNISSEELAEKTILIDINIYLSKYCIIAIHKRNPDLSIRVFEQKCMGLFPAGLEFSTVWDNAGNHIILAGGDGIDRQILAEALLSSAKVCGLTDFLNIAIGDVVDSYKNVSLSYKNACGILHLPAEPEKGILRIYSGDTPAPGLNTLDFSDRELSPIVQRAINYVTNRYSGGISMREFCAEANISASYFGYLFKKETGMYFNSYLLEFRMSKAVALLCHTGTKINDIAEMTGYSTPNYFITSFRNKTGLSPLKYREIYGGQQL